MCVCICARTALAPQSNGLVCSWRGVCDPRPPENMKRKYLPFKKSSHEDPPPSHRLVSVLLPQKNECAMLFLWRFKCNEWRCENLKS